MFELYFFVFSSKPCQIWWMIVVDHWTRRKNTHSSPYPQWKLLEMTIFEWNCHREWWNGAGNWFQNYVAQRGSFMVSGVCTCNPATLGGVNWHVHHVLLSRRFSGQTHMMGNVVLMDDGPHLTSPLKLYAMQLAKFRKKRGAHYRLHPASKTHLSSQIARALHFAITTAWLLWISRYLIESWPAHIHSKFQHVEFHPNLKLFGVNFSWKATCKQSQMEFGDHLASQIVQNPFKITLGWQMWPPNQWVRLKTTSSRCSPQHVLQALEIRHSECVGRWLLGLLASGLS